MCGTGIAMSLFFRQILGPLILCWAPDHFLLGAQLAPGEKRLVCIPVMFVHYTFSSVWVAEWPHFGK